MQSPRPASCHRPRRRRRRTARYADVDDAWRALPSDSDDDAAAARAILAFTRPAMRPDRAAAASPAQNGVGVDAGRPTDARTRDAVPPALRGRGDATDSDAGAPQTRGHARAAVPRQDAAPPVAALPADPRPGAKIFHTEPHIPGVKLFDERANALVPGKVPLRDLPRVLRGDPNLAVYVGQDGVAGSYPTYFLSKFPKRREHWKWRDELSKPPAERRIIIFDPLHAVVLSPEQSPTLDTLQSALETYAAMPNAYKRFLVFNSHYTDSTRITFRRWRSLFYNKQAILQARKRREAASTRARAVARHEGAPKSGGAPRAPSCDAPSRRRELRSASSPALTGEQTDQAGTMNAAEIKRDPCYRDVFPSSSSEYEDLCSSSSHSEWNVEFDSDHSDDPDFVPSTTGIKPARKSGRLHELAAARKSVGVQDTSHRSDSEDSSWSSLFEGLSTFETATAPGDRKSRRETLRLPGSRNEVDAHEAGDEHEHGDAQPSRTALRDDENCAPPLRLRLKNYAAAQSEQEVDSGFAEAGPARKDGAVPQAVQQSHDCEKERHGERGPSDVEKKRSRGTREGSPAVAGAVLRAVQEEQTAGPAGGLRSRSSKRCRSRSQSPKISRGNNDDVSHQSRATHPQHPAVAPSKAPRRALFATPQVDVLGKPPSSPGAPTPADVATCKPASSRPDAQSVSPGLATTRNPSDAPTPSASEKPLSPTAEASPPSAQPCQEVYIWDYATKKRSPIPFPLQHALHTCAGPRGEMKAIYDGQDLKFGDDRYPVQWTDKGAWISRKGTRPADARAVRVWNHSEGVLEKFRCSPQLRDLRQWLHAHSNHSVFHPALIIQQESLSPFTAPPLCPAQSVTFRVKKVIYEKVICRIRYLRVTDLCEGPQTKLMFWNTITRRCEPSRDFPSRAHVTRFLFANPYLQLYRRQDQLLQLEQQAGLVLISVNGKCPAKFGSFWDRREKKKYVRPLEDDRFATNTIEECISGEFGLELYLGQDIPQYDIVKQNMNALKSFPSAPPWYMLASCGKHVQEHVYRKGWVPFHIEVTSESTTNAAFWHPETHAVILQPQDGLFLSVQKYLETSPHVQLYVGQNMPKEVQQELADWFTLIKHPTCDQHKSEKPVLLKTSLMPLKYRAERITSGTEFRQHAKLESRPRKRRPSKGAQGLTKQRPQKTPEDQGDGLRAFKRQRTSLRPTRFGNLAKSHGASLSHSSEDPFSDEDEYIVPLRKVPPSPQDSDFSEENLDGNQGAHFDPSPASSTRHDVASDDFSDCESLDSSDASLFDNRNEASQDVEDTIRGAVRSAKKAISVIREAGPKVLNRELKHDRRQSLRERLILEVESAKQLLAFVKKLSSLEFVSLANELCERLENLDVHDCFSNGSEFSLSPPDLLSLREEVEAGRAFTVKDVVDRFREICGGLIQFHRGSALSEEALLLRFHGEEAIAQFQLKNRDALKQEEKFRRLIDVCEKAKQIGFRAIPNHRRLQKQMSAKSAGPVEPSLRVSGCHPEVTFLNYRDEKGNSVMGKRHSVRVFGFTIDRRSCEERIGNKGICHVCRREVFQSDGDSLRCSNHAFRICSEVICRECLDTVCSLERDEFIELRDAENWFCVHCRGLCPSGSACMKAPSSDAETSATDLERRVRFRWPHAACGATRVEAVIKKRRRDGEYDPTGSGKSVCLSRSSDGESWIIDLELRPGAYRCHIDVNGVGVASTTFQVFPALVDSDGLLQDEPGLRPVHVSYAQTRQPWSSSASKELTLRTAPRGPRVHWSYSRRFAAGPVHAIRTDKTDDGGTLVDQCSRTEGYDWRRAKRDATLQWIPEPQMPDTSPPQEQTTGPLILTAVDSRRAHLFAKDNPPKPRPGVSLKDFYIELNTFKYEEMVKKTLWGIVTGRSDIHGIGLFTLTGYRKGDFVIEYAGDLIRTPIADIREARYVAAGLGTYLFKINEDQIVDATVQSNRARFTNHSCDPNMVAEIIHVRGRDLVVLCATREIPRFSELTFDYKLPYEDKKVECLCNAWNCVGVMN